MRRAGTGRSMTVTGRSCPFVTLVFSSFFNLVIVVPPPSVLDLFERAATDMLEHVLISRRQSATLAALRDALLPRLISGDLRVKDAERIIGEATT